MHDFLFTLTTIFNFAGAFAAALIAFQRLGLYINIFVRIGIFFASSGLAGQAIINITGSGMVVDNHNNIYLLSILKDMGLTIIIIAILFLATGRVRGDLGDKSDFA